MEFVHVVGGGFVLVIIYLAFLRNRGGVKDIGAGTSRELMRHTTIIKGGVPFRPEFAEPTRETGRYKVTMHELQNDGRMGDSMPYVLNVEDYSVRVGMALVPGELVMEEKFDSVLELIDPVQKRLREEAVLDMLEGLKYKQLEEQVRDAEAGKNDLKKTVVTVRKNLIEYVKLIKTQQESIIALKGEKKAALSMLEAYQGAPETINRLVVAERAVTRLTKELADVKAGKTAEAEAMKSVLGREPADRGDVVVKT